MREIRLSQGKVALVDDEDFDSMSAKTWYAARDSHTFYAQTSNAKGVRPAILLMHRLIMDAPKGMQVDHIDGNGLNNCRGNLRIATARQNLRNSRVARGADGIRGVRFKEGRWVSQIRVEGARIWLGSFKTADEAARVYAAACVKHHGEFSPFARMGGHLG